MGSAAQHEQHLDDPVIEDITADEAGPSQYQGAPEVPGPAGGAAGGVPVEGIYPTKMKYRVFTLISLLFLY